ncbi:MAG TPA: SDR family NAD(P)-dependent oxidoreductase [Dehalococcoidia bacterium]
MRTYKSPAPHADRLRGRRALVTGAASGIGFACAHHLLAEGAELAIADIRREALDEAGQRLAGRSRTVACDVGDEDSVKRLVEHSVAALGGLDIVVTSAGIVRSGPTHTLSLTDWDTLIRVNLTGTFLVLKHAIPHLLAAGGGAIVTIGSVGSVVAAGRTSGYDASKGGVLQLTRAVAVEYCSRGIRANCVLPGIVQTGLAANSIAIEGPMSTDTSSAPAARLRVPMQRSADPEEIAAMVVFLASEEASFMTGAAVAVDGGYTAI